MGRLSSVQPAPDDNQNMAKHPHLPHVRWRGLLDRASPALVLGWAVGSQFDPRVATAFLELHRYAPAPAEDDSPKQQVRPVGPRRPHRSGASAKRASSRPGMPDLQLGKLARTNMVLMLVLVFGSFGLAQFVPVAAAPTSWPPPAWTGTEANAHTTAPRAPSEPRATRPPPARRPGRGSVRLAGGPLGRQRHGWPGSARGGGRLRAPRLVAQ